ncbi:cytochrome c [bacterium]|nr:cytochrome c [bacterium]
MKRCFLIVFVAAFVSGCESPSDYKPTTTNPQIIFAEACSWCHGKNAEGTKRGVSLTKTKLEKTRVREVLTKGTAKMPKFKNLNGEALENVIDYVAKLK